MRAWSTNEVKFLDVETINTVTECRQALIAAKELEASVREQLELHGARDPEWHRRASRLAKVARKKITELELRMDHLHGEASQVGSVATMEFCRVAHEMLGSGVLTEVWARVVRNDRLLAAEAREWLRSAGAGDLTS